MKVKVFILALICFSTVASAQRTDQTSFNVGFNPISQGFYAGLDYQIKNYSIGFDLGTSLGTIYPSDYLSFSLENNYYFGSENKYNLKTWHINARLGYETIYESLSNKPKRLSLIPAIGKSFSLNPHWSVNIDCGLNLQLYKSDNGGLVGSGVNYDLNNAVVPDLRIELRYKL
jgi:hypothetical protein